MKIFGSIFAIFMVLLVAYTLVGGPVAEMPSRPCRFTFNIISPVATRFVGAFDPESERGTREAFDAGQKWCASTVYAMTAGTEWFASSPDQTQRVSTDTGPSRSGAGVARSVEMSDSSGVLLARPETAAALKALPAPTSPSPSPPSQSADGTEPSQGSK